MELLSHTLSAEFVRSANIAKGLEEDAKPLIAFRDAQQLSLLVRATAVVFADPHSRALHDVIERVAPSEATVLITGETGTGKELVARHVHALSRRRDADFVAINCGAFSETLIESELFGYERGAFTGALQGKPGWFETAKGGTLFLDEIGDLPLAMQVKLLRVLQEREVVRLGARQAVPIDVRLIAATNIDLSEAVRAGRFREDLYYRLQVIALPVQPLRERTGDVMPLAHHFLQTYSKRLQVQDVRLGADAELALLGYPWPGNIRELENVIHRAVLLCRDGVIRAADLSLLGWQSTPPNTIETSALVPRQAPAATHGNAIRADKSEATQTGRFYAAWQCLLESGETIELEMLQQNLVVAAWEQCQRNQVHAARRLNISRNILRTHLKKAGAI